MGDEAFRGSGAGKRASQSSAPAIANGGARNRPLLIGAIWALRRVINLPNPFGVSLFVVAMSRDFEVSDVASSAVRNRTTLAALKLDAWILPLLNLCMLAGHTWTHTRLNAAITIDRIPPNPVVIDVTQDTDVGGPPFSCRRDGRGRMWLLVHKGGCDLHLLGHHGDGRGIRARFVSARMGWSGVIRWGLWSASAGAGYFTAQHTLAISQESSILGTVLVEVDQRPSTR